MYVSCMLTHTRNFIVVLSVLSQKIDLTAKSEMRMRNTANKANNVFFSPLCYDHPVQSYVVGMQKSHISIEGLEITNMKIK